MYVCLSIVASVVGLAGSVSYTHLVQGRRDKNAGSKWTEDRKKRHNENMKEY